MLQHKGHNDKETCVAELNSDKMRDLYEYLRQNFDHPMDAMVTCICVAAKITREGISEDRTNEEAVTEFRLLMAQIIDTASDVIIRDHIHNPINVIGRFDLDAKGELDN